MTYTGHVPLDFTTGNDQAWHGKLLLYLNDRDSLEYKGRNLRAVRFECLRDPLNNPKVIRQQMNLPFEPLAVSLALSGMHTGDDSQSTYGVSGTARIEPTPKPPTSPGFAGSRPSITANLGVWGEDAHLGSVSFHLTVLAEARRRHG